jgi:hypothetical protein
LGFEKMSSKLFIRLSLLTWLLIGTRITYAESLDAESLELDSIKTYLMDPNGISLDDIDLYPAHVPADAFRLSRINRILHSPLQLDSVASEISRRTTWDTSQASLPVSPDLLWPLLDIEPAQKKAETAKLRPSNDMLPPDSGFKPELAFKAIANGLHLHGSKLSEAEKTFLFQQASGLFLQAEEDTALDAITGELRRLQEKARLNRLMELAGKLEWPGLVAAASAAWQLETWMIKSARTFGFAWTIAQLKRATKKGSIEKIPIHFGTSGPDLVKVDEGIWIDPGGDDEYQISGPRRLGAFLLILDLAGHDIYFSKDSLSQSSGNMGINLIADLAGNDRYLGQNFAFGSTMFGYASVFDAAGHDNYEGRCASLGFGFFGLGLIQDQSGNDVYSASLMSQGLGSTMGLGLLLDRAGNDQYLARPTFKDDLRYNDHNIHMVQGFATGFAPDYSGGIGVLRDGSGNDFYLADIFGQGSAYWFALGLLLDETGDDRYASYQYAQGAGVHIAVGALLDYGGNDNYAAKGVSQGCGHDLGFGLLFDRTGDDHYLATDMSQGAGSANGLGILHDSKGQDIYESKNLEMALGHADMRRDRGSFGFFLDGAGLDRYRLPHADGSAWRVFNGKTKGNGYGLDR